MKFTKYVRAISKAKIIFFLPETPIHFSPRVDQKEILRRDWMFKLVGTETFTVGKANCVVKVEPVGGFSYQYTLEVNGKPYEKFVEQQSREGDG